MSVEEFTSSVSRRYESMKRRGEVKIDMIPMDRIKNDLV
jgi:hypothetical protein